MITPLVSLVLYDYALFQISFFVHLNLNRFLHAISRSSPDRLLEPGENKILIFHIEPKLQHHTTEGSFG